MMESSEYMGVKYSISGEIHPHFFPSYKDWNYVKICRYAEGFVYRLVKSCCGHGEIPWKSRIVFCSVDKKEMYQTEVFDQVRIHMTDFEHGVPYAVGFDFLSDGEWLSCKCAGEIWQDSDIGQICPVPTVFTADENGFSAEE